jgi:hypothetical protein
MKNIAFLAVLLFWMLVIFGCAAITYQGGSGTEMHPGHVGHEIHTNQP